MAMKKFLSCAIGTVSLFTAQLASAGEFSVACSYKNTNLEECASVVADIVTDKFIAKFPAKKFQIFVHSNVHSYTNGGYTAYAVTGVVPHGSGQFPVDRYSSTSTNGTDKKFTNLELAKVELENFRAVVTNLMNECEISPTCDVYRVRNKK